MEVQINKSGEGLEKTFNFNGNNFAISQCGEDYNGTLVLWLNEIEHSFCCYEDGSENYCSRKEALNRLTQKAKDLIKQNNRNYEKIITNSIPTFIGRVL